MSTVLTSIRDFQSQQKALLSKYTSLRSAHKEVAANLHKLLWTDLGSEIGYDFLAIKDVSVMKETESTVGDYSLGELLGEGQFAQVRSCKEGDSERTLAVKIIKKDSVVR